MMKWDQNSPICDSLDLFSNTLWKIFDHIILGPEAARAIMDPCQGNH